ncbi:MAG: matrixin family metalloprotease, partial [Dehalococcoidia bacterium]
PVLVAFGLMLALLAADAAPTSADGPHEDVPAGWTLYDGGALLSPADYDPGAMPLELIIDFFANGSPAVKWATTSSPTVSVCTYHQDRPASISAERFRESVTRAAALWNAAEAAVGIKYTGDCEHGTNWESDNRRNEIGWDDFRNIVRAPAAAVTQGSWLIHPGRREFVETDIILDHRLDVPPQCLDSTIAHELGHALGLGHSTSLGDLMYPSFDSGNISTCPLVMSDAEAAFVQGMYGVNHAPSLVLPSAQEVVAGARATIEGKATDPEGDALTYTWSQTTGTPVGFTPTGATLAFDVPNVPDSQFAFTLTATDQYLHAATAQVVLNVVGKAAGITTVPVGAPSLETLAPSATGRMSLGWTESTGASEYHFCSRPSGAGQQSCAPQATPFVEVTWPTVLGAAGMDVPLRVFTTGTRETSLQACNDFGCTSAGVGPHTGGLRWSQHGVDYDYFAMSFDVPGTSVRFTIAGVVNLSGPARRFELYAGTA